MPISPLRTCLRTITPSRKEFRLQCAWGLILPGTGQISTSQAPQSTKPKSAPSNVKEDASLPPGGSCDCVHFPIHLEGGKRLGCWLCCWKERENLIKDPKLLPKILWACPKCEQPLCLNHERYCFTEFHQIKMGGWIVVYGEGVGLLLREVDFGGASEFTKRATCKKKFLM